MPFHAAIQILIFGTILIFCLNFKNGDCSKILSVSFMSTRSHKITYEPLLESLASKGHEVTVLSPIPAKKTVKNMREILTIHVDEAMAGMPNMFELKEKNQKIDIFQIYSAVLDNCNKSLDLPHVQALRNETFDLIFVPAVINECALGYAYSFNTSIILISPLSIPGGIAAMLGNPLPSSFVPNVFLGYSNEMSFYERMMNFLADTILPIIMHLFYKPQDIYRAKLDSNLPIAGDILKEVNLILSNSHFSITHIKPFLPNIVEVGGMHCKSAKPLPLKLENFVEGSGDDGFILFSMGSALKASQMPEAKRQMIIGAFAQLKQRVLWKWEAEEMPDLPNNVKLSKWLPQQDVLGHPKIRLFITHGGFGSTTEAVYHGVPLVGVAMFGDQAANMEEAEKAGYAYTLDFNTFTEESFLKAIKEVLQHPRYKENASRLSAIFRDQPDHPLDRAIYWTEYVIRHKGAAHLKSAGRELNYFQYNSYDVIGFLVLIILTACYIVITICKFLFKSILAFMFGKSKVSISTNKKKKS